MGLTTIVNKQRKLSAEISIDDQISNLKSLIKNAPENSRVCEISPELAEYILENLNINNRPRKANKIVEYKKDMQENNWSLTGETIKFGTDGFLKDGQNRLAACVQAQTPFTTHVIFGIDPETFHHMDTGKNRGGDDILAIMGVKQSKNTSLLIKFLLNWEAGRTNTSGVIQNQRIKDAYLNKYDVELLKESLSWGRQVYDQTRYPIGQTSSTYYMAVEAGLKDEIERFFTAMINGTGSATSGPVKLMKHVTQLRNSFAHISSHDYSVLLSRAVHAHVNKKKMTKADLHVTLADRRLPLPFAK